MKIDLFFFFLSLFRQIDGKVYVKQVEMKAFGVEMYTRAHLMVQLQPTNLADWISPL